MGAATISHQRLIDFASAVYGAAGPNDGGGRARLVLPG